MNSAWHLLQLATAQTGEPAPGGGLMGFLPLIIIFVIFYFLLIRPQQKQAKKHREFLAALKTGDMVVTSGGIFGRVTALTDATVTLEVAPNVRIKVQRGSIAGLRPEIKDKEE